MAVDIDKLKKAIEFQPKLTGKGNQKPQITTDFNIDELSNKANQQKAPITTQPIQPKTETQTTQATTKMWTGSGWASVNPAYADEYLAKGWTYEGPSQSQMSEMIDVANKGGQAVWTPEGIKNIEGSTTTSTPTSTTTNTYTPLPGYQTVNANSLKSYLNNIQLSGQQGNKAPITTQPIQPTNDSNNLYNQMIEAQKQKRLAELSGALQKNLGTLSETESNVNRQAIAQRTGFKQDAQSKAKDFENYLANMGLLQSGTSAQGEIASNVALQGALTQSNIAQGQSIDAINRQRANLQTDYNMGVATTGADFDIANLQNAIDRQNLLDERAYQQSLLNQQLQRELSKQDFQKQIDTLGQYYSDFSAEIQRREAINPNDPLLPYLRMAREQKKSDLKTIEKDSDSQSWENAYKKWNSYVPLTQEEMQILGTNQAVKPKTSSGGSSGSRGVVKQSDVIARWKALGYADDTVANYFGIPKNSTYGEAFAQQLQQSQPQGLQVNVPTKTDVLSNMQGSLSDRADYIARLILSGQMDEIEANNPSLYDEIEQIALNYGINENVLTQAINRLGVSSQSYGRGNTTQPLTQYR